MQLDLRYIHNKKIKVGSVYYKVKVKIIKSCNKETPMARLDATKCTITINMIFNRGFRLGSFIHEIVEAIRLQNGLALSHTNISVISENLAAFLVDNRNIWRRK